MKIIIDEFDIKTKINHLINRKYDFYCGFNNELNYSSDFTKNIFFNKNLLYLENINNLQFNHITSISRIYTLPDPDSNTLYMEGDYPENISIYKYLYLLAIMNGNNRPNIFIFECRRENIIGRKIYLLSKSIFVGEIKYNENLDDMCREKMGIITDKSIFSDNCIIN